MATIPADGKVVEGAPVVLATTATVVANPAPMPTEVPLAHVEGGIAPLRRLHRALRRRAESEPRAKAAKEDTDHANG